MWSVSRGGGGCGVCAGVGDLFVPRGEAFEAGALFVEVLSCGGFVVEVGEEGGEETISGVLGIAFPA